MNLNLLEPKAPEADFWAEPEWPGDFWPLLFDRLPHSLIVFDREGRVLLANEEAVLRLGLTELDDAAPPVRLDGLRNAIFQLEARGGRGQAAATLASPVDGRLLSFHLRSMSYQGTGFILAVGQEAADREAAAPPSAAVLDETAAVAQASRQIGGPLAGIELYASIVDRELREAGDSALADLMERIRHSVREVNEYLTGFESMARPLKLNLASHKLMDIFDEALGAMNGVFKERNIGVLATQKDLTLEVDRGLMVQVFLNLLLNSVEAMPGGGRIFVEFDIEKPGLAEIIITDTGPGVSMEEMKRVFSPFYTTKAQPLGLGLPVSQRIVQAHQGSLILGSDVKLGARAALRLPFLPEGLAPGGALN